MQRSHYNMPALEGILYKLPKARLFTLVGVRDAFLHRKLDDDKLDNFLDTMRLFKLPYIEPEIYQRKQHKLLMGLM